MHIAILLCAGYGTRLQELGFDTPKPLLELAGRPMLDYLVDQVAAFDDLDAIHIVTNSRFYADFADWAAARRDQYLQPIAVHDDGTGHPGERLGAVGDLRFLLGRLGAADEGSGALVAAGDNVFRFSLAPFWRAFRARGASTVLALAEEDPRRLRRTGVLELQDERVVRLVEKPANPPSTWSCPSIYGLDAEALSLVGPYLDAGEPGDEIGRFIAWVATRQPLWAHRMEGERLHVGDPTSFRHADEVLRGAARTPEDVLDDAG
ncbi:MAG: sugar phosphate nucleotidyltransferase [Acidobacteriota bacterium]